MVGMFTNKDAEMMPCANTAALSLKMAEDDRLDRLARLQKEIIKWELTDRFYSGIHMDYPEEDWPSECEKYIDANFDCELEKYHEL